VAFALLPSDAFSPGLRTQLSRSRQVEGHCDPEEK